MSSCRSRIEVLRETAPATTSARNQAIAVAHRIEQRHSMLPNASPNHNIIAIIGLDGLFYCAGVFHLSGDAGAVQGQRRNCEDGYSGRNWTGEAADCRKANA